MIEEVLSSSIAAVFFTAFIISALMWYACLSTALELFGPSRYQFCVDIERRVKSVNSIFLNKANKATIAMNIGKKYQIN